MWDVLKAAADAGRDRSILGLFEADADRAAGFSVTALTCCSTIPRRNSMPTPAMC